MLNRGGPRVLHQHVDSKRELEKQLKAACESFIMAATKAAVEPMLSFITKVTAVKVAAQASPGTSKPFREQVGGRGGWWGSCCWGCWQCRRVASSLLHACDNTHRAAHLCLALPSTPRPPHTSPVQAFSSPGRLVQMVAKVNEGLAAALPAVVAKMRLYLPSPNTRAILFKPIKSNIAEAHGQVRDALRAPPHPCWARLGPAWPGLASPPLTCFAGYARAPGSADPRSWLASVPRRWQRCWRPSTRQRRWPPCR
jgi:hypothetical protein